MILLNILINNTIIHTTYTFKQMVKLKRKTCQYEMMWWTIQKYVFFYSFSLCYYFVLCFVEWENCFDKIYTYKYKILELEILGTLEHFLLHSRITLHVFIVTV